jgi:hypothetical protein
MPVTLDQVRHGVDIGPTVPYVTGRRVGCLDAPPPPATLAKCLPPLQHGTTSTQVEPLPAAAAAAPTWGICVPPPLPPSAA